MQRERNSTGVVNAAVFTAYQPSATGLLLRPTNPLCTVHCSTAQCVRVRVCVRVHVCVCVYVYLAWVMSVRHLCLSSSLSQLSSTSS